jgi:microcystin-dependent protein
MGGVCSYVAPPAKMPTNTKPMRNSFLIILLFASAMALAQAPHGFQYQAVARDLAGDPLANTAIGIRIQLHQGSAAGTVVYAETHATATSVLGLFQLEVGGGTPGIGTFAGIDWSAGPYFLEVGMDPAGGSSYTPMGTQQLLSVPYALYAETARSSNLLADSALMAPYCFPIGTDLSAKYSPAGGFQLHTGNDVWQSFTVNSTGDLNKLYWYVHGNGIVNGTVEVYEGEGTSGTLLTSRTVPDGMNHYNFFLNPTVPVQQGLQYTFRLLAPTDFPVSYQTTEGGYAHGRCSWDSGKDITFRAEIMDACVDSVGPTIQVNDTTGLELNSVVQITFSDGSHMTTAPVPDNLGDHTATQALDMAANDIDNAGTVNATSFVGDGSALTNLPVQADDQDLSLNGEILSIEDGNAVDLNAIDNQQLNLITSLLAIQNGNTIDLASILTPIGAIMMWPTATPPSGWLICDGGTFNTTAYPELNTVLGGNTKPNFRGRFALGTKPPPVNQGETIYNLGDTGGEEKHTLTIAEMPAHDHGIQYRQGEEQGSGNNYSDLSDTGVDDSTGSTGGGEAHNNMPPYVVVNYIIKARHY